MNPEQKTETRPDRYVVVTPVRNEEKYIESTLQSVIKQTVPPAEWVIVDDGSSDKTASILDDYAQEFPWITVVHRVDRGFRKSGSGVMEAFSDGLMALKCKDWNFIVKLDGDLTFGLDYFEKCLDHFRENVQLGIGGGDIYHQRGEALEREVNPRFHVRGATKIYRKECWEAIGGLWPAPGWDTIDEVKANMLGWQTCTFLELRLLHHRVTGSAEGAVRDRIKHGLVCYVSGYHPLFLAASCLKRVTKQPYVIGSAAILYGYLKGCIAHMPRMVDRSYVAYIRNQQLRRLLGMETIWK